MNSTNQRFTQSALLIHGLAWAATLTVGILAVLNISSEVLTAFIGVSLVAAIVLFYWSVWLAARAIAARAPLFLPIIIVFASFSAIVLPLTHATIDAFSYTPRWTSSYLGFIISTGLPLLIPFSFVVLVAAAPWAFTMRSAASPSLMPRLLSRYLKAVAAMSVLAVPYVLFLYCVLMPSYLRREESDAWRKSVLTYTPDFIRHQGATLLSLLPQESVNDDYRYKLIFSGGASVSMLYRFIETDVEIDGWYGGNDHDPVCEEAFRVLCEHHPQEAYRFSLDVFNGTRRIPRWITQMVASTFAEHGSVEEINKCLNSPRSTPLRAQLIYQLGYNRRSEFAPRIQQIVKEDSADALIAMSALPRMVAHEKIESLWSDLIMRPQNRSSQSLALELAKGFRVNIRTRLILGAFSMGDETLRRNILRQRILEIYPPDKQQDLIPLVKFLKELLSQDDVALRRGSFAQLYTICLHPWEISRSPSVHYYGQEISDPDARDDRPESEMEKEDFAKMRVAVEEWLKKTTSVE